MACQPFEVLFRQPAPTNAGSQTIRSTAILRNFKVLLFAIVIFAVAGSAYAFAAQNTVEDSAAGYKASVVPGYTVTNLVYDLDSADPSIVDAITFDISPSSGSSVAVVVKVQTATAGTCTYGTLALEDVTALNIVANSTTDP